MSEALWFVDPTAGTSRAKIALARRPIDLVGKVVGLLDNTKEQGNLILAAVAQDLLENHGVKDVVIERKHAFSRPATAQQLDSLAERVDVAVAAVGG